MPRWAAGYDNVASDYATVGGGYSNTASSYSATVGGGSTNTASDYYATVGGGENNTASSNYATVGGGYGNIASGQYDTETYAVVGGGSTNTASDYYATVGGGYGNTASGISATVGGGYGNTASGYTSTVCGGTYNTASGASSFAAGRRAKAYHSGAFVWADDTDADFSSSGGNQFNVRASGGVRMYTNSGTTLGAQLLANATAWTALSDSTKKTDIRRVDTKAVLEKIAQLPISEWRYKAQPDPSIRHMGPMAQDFWKLFGLGEDSLGISTIDPDGIALAAIQELQKQNEELRTAVRRYAEELNELRGLVEKMAARTNQENPKTASAAFSRNTSESTLKEIAR